MMRLPSLSLPLGLAVALVVAETSGLPVPRPAVAAGAPSWSAATVARLRANGLSPADLHLHAKLVRLAGHRKLAPPPMFLSRFHEPKPVRTTKGTAAFFKGRLTSIMVPGHGTSSVPTPVISGLFNSNLGEAVEETPIISGFPTAIFTFGSCGSINEPPDSEDVTYSPGTGSAQIAGYDVTLIDDQWATPVVAKHTASTMAVQFGSGPISNALPFLAEPTYSTGDSMYSQPIGDKAPSFLSSGGPLALQASEFATTTSPVMAAKANRVSTNVSDPTQTGTDTIGYGVNLVNGWQATATITDVHSYRDAHGNNGSSDAFRSATVSQQPQSGRLETKVSWSYEGGESLSYHVKWTFTKGVVIARVADSAPKLTTCSGEK